MRRREHPTTPETTAALVQACKQKVFSVTSAIHAAYIKVLMKHADPKTPTSYISVRQHRRLRPPRILSRVINSNVSQHMATPPRSRSTCCRVSFSPLRGI
ncbi:hypothetical protein BO79DRAFT_251472 [Aspergillus costaricaensis CBS 115574]|uniref:Uncharacterized protein n=1 Tax=Aspergillus costaricaensis CBS 115574 TaxID=1448317 RepID=A0ACD1INU7_9EURO|nr:hypothetical protein BO79DRAFT_251472 [Aspergillus costaricaensis CBS 115574]RAK92177.1 hypothetical protein BO79DRAFT_251472 [Aspergillus costaricaensis CBS 115574]